MPQSVNLKRIERNAWMSFFEDGLLDVLMGLTLLAVGIPAMLPNFFVSELRQDGASAALMVLALFGFWLAKRFITMPRIGRARFGPARKAKLRKTAVIYGISALAGLIVFVVSLMPTTRPSQGTPWSASVVVALGIGAWMLLILGLASYFFGFHPRTRDRCVVRAGVFGDRLASQPDFVHHGGCRGCTHGAGRVRPLPAQVPHTVGWSTLGEGVG